MADNRPISRRKALGVLGCAASASAAARESSAAKGSPVAAQAGGSPPDQPRTLTPDSSDTGSLYPGIERLAERGGFSASFLGDRWPSLEEYRTEGRKILLRALGYNPPPVDPRPEVVSRVDLGGVIREKVLFSTTPEFRVPAYVHVPKNRSGRLPAVVDLHSHGGMYVFGKEKVIDFGVNHPAMVEYQKENYAGRPTATELARRGYVVITIDAFPFGERRLMMDEDLKYGWERSKYTLQDVRMLNAKCREKESAVVKSLTYAGATWPGVVAWDDMRTVDYLATRPEVDPARIGCCGVSMGGWRSLLLSGLDDRITAGCVAGFMSTVRPMIRRHMETHSFVHFIPGLHEYLDLPDVVALRAPKPLLVLQCKRDELFPLEGMQDAVRKIAAVYSKGGAPDAFTGKFYDVPHRFDVPMQEDAFGWFDKHLK
jgi:dienelactone hydrolase